MTLPPRPRVRGDELDELIEQATVDCYNEAEQVTGLFTMIEEYLALPFQTQVLGMTVSIAGIDLTDDDQIVAICRRTGSAKRTAHQQVPGCFAPSSPSPTASHLSTQTAPIRALSQPHRTRSRSSPATGLRCKRRR
jgi:hypothetical protein